MRLSIKSMGIIVVVAFVAGVGGAAVLGFWKTTSSKQPVAIKEGEFAGLPNPSDIRGSYTWADVAKAFNFDVKLALDAFRAASETEKVNTLETIYGEAGLPEGVEIGTDSVRLFVSLLTGLPHIPEEGTILPSSAIAVLRDNGKAETSLIEAAAAKAFNPAAAANPAAANSPPASPAPLSPTPASASLATSAPAPASAVSSTTTTTTTTTTVKAESASLEHVATPGTITGKTTFKELKDWGLDEEKIKTAAGGKIGPDGSVIKDWAAANGLTFSELKIALQGLFPVQ
ncbi:MAG TPA: hypothetical protein VN445_12095 [Rectinemataceae bacterium]|nr:hypothetical protein [Rectinemataceae bacterium]